VAEGVDTEAERARLHHLGLAIGQGFLFDQARPLADFFSGDLPIWSWRDDGLQWSPRP